MYIRGWSSLDVNNPFEKPSERPLPLPLPFPQKTLAVSHPENACMPGSAADMSSPKLAAMSVRLTQRRRSRLVPVSPLTMMS